MSETTPIRRLAAIMSVDMVGYSRLMRSDEIGTLERLKGHMREVVRPAIAQHHGRIVKTTGDGALVEFTSVVDAVTCGVEIQRTMQDRNSREPEGERLQFRIGINLGDVIVDDDDIFGDGVNVASRLEGLAEPGGICVSGIVYEQLKNKLAFSYSFLGRQQVKNIAEPVPVFAVGLEDEPAPGRRLVVARPRRGLRWALAGLAVVLLLAAAGGWAWWRALPGLSPQQSAGQVSEKPSIAVLPLANLSGGDAQDYFGDGIAESIITELSRFSELTVIARNSTFAYRGKSNDVRQISQDLNVRYVLQGSVQRSQDRVRISVQLADAATGQQIWAERFDREMADLFAVQDEIANAVAGNLAVKVAWSEQDRAFAKPATSLDAYDKVLRGRALIARKTREANFQARALFEEAVAMAPDYGPAYVGLGRAYLEAAVMGWSEFVQQSLQKAFELAQQAIRLHNTDAAAHRLLGQVHLYRKEYGRAADALRRAIELNPNDAQGIADYGAVLLWSSRLKPAIEKLEAARRFDPRLDVTSMMTLGLAYYLDGRHHDAIATLEQSLHRNPDYLPSYVVLAAACGQLGDSAGAEQALARVRRLDPFFSPDAFNALLSDPAHRALISEGLKKAGL